MARIRQVKPAFFKHADLYDAEVSSGLPLRIAFEALWTVADRRGIFPWSRNIKPDVIPYDPVDMLAVLDALAAAGFVTRYEVGGKAYGTIPTLGEHQHFHKDEKASALPAPPEHPANNGTAPDTNGADTVQQPDSKDASTAVAGRHTASGIRHTKSELTTSSQKSAASGREKYAVAFEALWALYPPRAGGNSKKAAQRAWSARLKAGVDAEQISAGLVRYAAFVTATKKAGTQFVMMAATFFGPDEHWAEPWTVPAVVVAPPRFASPTEQAARQDKATEALEEQYSVARHRTGAVWAKNHPEQYAPIKALVDASYRGIPSSFAERARTIELATRCGDAANFPDFESWRVQHGGLVP